MAESRRILHVVHGVTLGGAERSMLALAEAQRRLGHRPTVAAGGNGPVLHWARQAGLDAIDLRFSTRFINVPQQAGLRTILVALPGWLSAARHLRRAVERVRPEIVHAHTRKAQLVSSLALVGRSERLIWHLRDDPPARGVVRVAVRALFWRVDHAVVLAEWMIGPYEAVGGLPRSRRLGIVPSGVDTTDLVGLPTPWLDGAPSVVIGYIGQIAERKGPQVLVDAAALLTDLSDVRYVIVGDVLYPAAEGPFGARLAAQIAAPGLRDRVTWKPGTDTPSEAFRAIDILAHPSILAEPFGRVLVEAMAARRPIIAVRSGAAASLLDDDAAVLIDAPVPALLARAIRSLVSDRPLAIRLAEAAARRPDSFQPLEIANQMDAEYDTVR